MATKSGTHCQEGLGDCDEFYLANEQPAHYEDYRKKIEEFCDRFRTSSDRVALVTSGGTTVPLEHNTVRFVDNFSLGTRGSASAEVFLECGYAVIFLHRKRSLLPFARHFDSENLLEYFQMSPDDSDTVKIEVVSEKIPKLLPWLKRYQELRQSGRLLSLSFTTLSEYLWLLRAAAEALGQLDHRALFYLAAAVSDFYVPPHDMSTHKIHSDSPLSIKLNMVPKMLRPLVSRWVPKAFIISFKLETEPSILIDKAKRALQNYGHNIVVANLLTTRKASVILVTRTREYPISMTTEELDAGLEIEKKIVQELVDRHGRFISNGKEIGDIEESGSTSHSLGKTGLP